nr:unnamed protein product [Haemonchus contortus]
MVTDFWPLEHPVAPRDLDLLACELSQIGLSASNNGAASPPPPAPPPRDASIANVTNCDDNSVGGTLRGPNKPLPPTPTGSSPSKDFCAEDSVLHAKRNSCDLSRPNMVKASSLPDQTPATASSDFGLGDSSSDSGADDHEFRTSARQPSGKKALLPIVSNSFLSAQFETPQG